MAKKTKLKTILISLISFLMIFGTYICINSVNENKKLIDEYTEQVIAASSTPTFKKVTVGGSYADLVVAEINEATNPVSYFYTVNTNTNEQEKIDSFGKKDGKYYFSLKNGTYKLYLVDSKGMASGLSQNITITTSCSEKPAYNVTGSGTAEKCYVSNGVKGEERPANYNDIATCAPGYVFDEVYTKEIQNGCTFNALTDIVPYGVENRYCKKVYQYSCVPKGTSGTTQNDTTTKLVSLSIDNGSLSPAFNPDVVEYTATVNASSVNVNATLQQDGSSFVANYGPRNVSLKYGTNTILIKAQSSSGKEITYTLKIKRPDNRSNVNTLKSLAIEGVTLNETFAPSRTTYTGTVSNDVRKIYIEAELTDSNKSSFVKDYGPRTFNLGVGTNSILIKVKSEIGTTKTYTIKITREGSGEQTEQPIVSNEDLGLLQSLTLQQENINLDPAFDAKVLEYNVTVPYEVESLLINAVPKSETDTVEINGNENFKVEEVNVVTIKVSTPNDFDRIYTINVVRKGEDLVISNDSSLKELTIKDKEIEFASDKLEYEVILNKDETSLDITAVANDENATVEITDNENLVIGSMVRVRVIAEDATFTDYVITIAGIEKGTNVFLIIIVVILLVLIIAYTILRILGYKIYFNFSMLTSLFRGKNKDAEDE